MMTQANVSTSSNNSIHDHVIGLRWNSSKYAPDTVEFVIPNASKSATMYGAVFWPKSLSSNLYEIPIDLTGLSKLTLARIGYIVGYLERATLISFREPRPTDTTIVKVLERSYNGCWSNVGKGIGERFVYMNLHPAVCTTLHMYLHEFMHLLGFVHEHERPDAQIHYFAQLPNPVQVGFSTEFDSFSVMNYPREAIGDLKNPWLNEVSKGRRTFLSRCDWSLLLSIYPGKNIAPRCIVNYAPKVLKPSTKLLSIRNEDYSNYLCQYNNEWLYETKYCVTINSKTYPDLSVELGFLANEYSNKRLRDPVFYPSILKIISSDISSKNQTAQNDLTFYANANQSFPLTVKYSFFDKETCLLIYDALAASLFVKNCGPTGETVCKEVASPEDLKIWLQKYFSQCFRSKNNKMAVN